MLAIAKQLMNLFSDVARNRLLNKHTSKGISLLVVVAVGMGYLKENEANLIINLLSGMNITYIDIWILGINIALLYLGFRAIKLISRASDCLFEEKILKKHNTQGLNNNNNNKL